MFWCGWLGPRWESVSGSFECAKAKEKETDEGKKKNTWKIPSGSEVAWLDSQRLQSCDIPFGLSCHTLIFLLFSRSVLIPFLICFRGVSLHILGLVPFSSARVVRLFFFSFSHAFFYFIFFYSICPAEQDLFPASPRYIFFLLATLWQLLPPLLNRTYIFDSMAR